MAIVKSYNSGYWAEDSHGFTVKWDLKTNSSVSKKPNPFYPLVSYQTGQKYIDFSSSTSHRAGLSLNSLFPRGSHDKQTPSSCFSWFAAALPGRLRAHRTARVSNLPAGRGNGSAVRAPWRGRHVLPARCLRGSSPLKPALHRRPLQACLGADLQHLLPGSQAILGKIIW